MVKKQKLNLIEELTTHKCDFQTWPLLPVQANPENRPRVEPKVKPSPFSLQIDPQSHAPYHPSAYVPFDLYLLPKPIVGTDPRECFNLRKPPNHGCSRAGVQLSTILPPTLPLEEIEDEKDLENILRYTYTGMHKKLMEEASLNISKRLIPPNRVVPEGNTVRFKSNIYPPLPPGWIAAARHWDCLQSRNLGDPFKTFWSRRGPEIECGCCCNSLPNIISKETKEEIKNLVSMNKLRLPYDVTKTGYGGYRPVCARGVPFEES